MNNKHVRVFVLIEMIILIVVGMAFLRENAKADSSDVAGINTGTAYYLKNVGNGKYLTVQGGYNLEGNDVITGNYSNDVAYRWLVIRNNDGSYRFYSFGNSGCRVLKANGNNIEISTYNSTYTSQKFSILRYSFSSASGTYRIMSGSKYVTATSTTVGLTYYGTGTDTLWALEPVNKGDASYLAFNYPGFDTRGAASTFVSNCGSMGYGSAYFVNCDPGYAYNWMKNDAIWVFMGHGAYFTDGTPCATIVFKDSSGGTTGYITARTTGSLSGGTSYRIPNMTANAMGKAVCVLFVGCSTGVTYQGDNLVSKAFGKGAHFAIGTTQTVDTLDMDSWTKDFFIKANTGATIQECLNYANYRTNLGQMYYEGDVYSKLK